MLDEYLMNKCHETLTFGFRPKGDRKLEHSPDSPVTILLVEYFAMFQSVCWIYCLNRGLVMGFACYLLLFTTHPSLLGPPIGSYINGELFSFATSNISGLSAD